MYHAWAVPKELTPNPLSWLSCLAAGAQQNYYLNSITERSEKKEVSEAVKTSMPDCYDLPPLRCEEVAAACCCEPSVEASSAFQRFLSPFPHGRPMCHGDRRD